VHALKGGFPFYGELETDPVNAATGFRSGGGALVEETVLRQFQANVGDGISLGKLTNNIVGRLKKVPGQTVALSGFAPAVYISMDDVAATDLLQRGSLARYQVFFKFGPDTDVPKLLESILPQLERFRLGHDTVEERSGTSGGRWTTSIIS